MVGSDEAFIPGTSGIPGERRWQALLVPVPDDSAGALDDLHGLALLVNLAKTGPAGSPSFMLESTLMRGMLCSMQGGDQLLVHGLGFLKLSERMHRMHRTRPS